MAGPTRLELATSGVTGQRSNQLNYDPAWVLQPLAPPRSGQRDVAFLHRLMVGGAGVEPATAGV